MMPRAPPIVTPPSVLRLDWETLARLASTWSKLLDLNVCPTSTSLCRFCGVTNKLKPAWFWGINQETVAVILRPKSPNRSCGFEVQIEKPSTLVLRLKQETRAPPLIVHGTDRKWWHPTSRSFDHRVSDLCLFIPGHLHHVSYFCLDPHCCPPCRTCHLHHETSKRDSPHKQR
jgi:hypothetical protein